MSLDFDKNAKTFYVAIRDSYYIPKAVKTEV